MSAFVELPFVERGAIVLRQTNVIHIMTLEHYNKKTHTRIVWSSGSSCVVALSLKQCLALIDKACDQSPVGRIARCVEGEPKPKPKSRKKGEAGQ